MCNNTSLSHFLEGVNFMDEEMTMSDLQLEEEFFGEDGNLLMLDMSMNMNHDVDMDMDMEDAGEEGGVSSVSLPPLAVEGPVAGSEDLDALLSPPEAEKTSPGGVPVPVAVPAPAPLVHQTSLEKLAHCMRRSELSLKERQGTLKLSASQSPALMKANPFFTGSRYTITPELEQSRQQLWSFVRQQQQYMHKAPFTAAA